MEKNNGRPKIEITDVMLGKVQGISTMQCPDEEIAAPGLDSQQQTSSTWWTADGVLTCL